MMKRTLTLALVAAISVSAWPVCAQTATDARKLALTREYMELANVTKMMNSAMGAMATAIKPGADTPPEVATAMKEAVVESASAVFPSMMERMAQMYAEAYTVEELEAIVAFFKSPAGRSMTAKNEKLLVTAVPAMMNEFGPRLEQEMVERLCAKLSCTPEQKGDLAKRFGSRR